MTSYNISTHQAAIKHSILYGMSVHGCVQIAMSHLKLGELDNILRIQEAELYLLAITLVKWLTRFDAGKTDMTFGAWCETTSFIVDTMALRGCYNAIEKTSRV